MKPWVIAICTALALPATTQAQEAAAPTAPAPEATWKTGARPGFVRAIGFAENTIDTPVKARAIRPDLGPVYAWKGTPLWLLVDVDPASTGFTRLCVEWTRPDPATQPLRDCQPLPGRPGRLRFAAPDNHAWPEARYSVRLSALAACPPGSLCAIRPSDLGAVAYAVGDRPHTAAANGHGHDVPAFPWPPPRPSTRTVIDRNAAFAGATTLGDASERLSAALHAAGYASPAFYAAPGGYAMVARLEQIEADGTPKPAPTRWSAALPQREVFSLADYLKALFSAPEGHYRVIVFIVSDQPFATAAAPPSQEQADAWLQGGLNVLPAAIARLPLDTDHTCTALIYQFHKQGFEGQPTSVLDGAAEATQQLQRSRIIDPRGRLLQ